MIKYGEIDELIVAAVTAGKNPLYDRALMLKSDEIVSGTKKDSFRVIDRRLQALRKKERIRWLTKREDANGIGGWKIYKAQP